MRVLRFEIRHGDGRMEQLLLDAERVLIGSAGHCEIRLGVGEAAPEHVAIEANAGIVRAQARAFDPQAMINGVAFTEAPLSPDAILQIGRTQMRVSLGEAAQGETVQKAKQNKTSPMTLVLAFIALPLGAYVLLDDDGGD